MSLLKRFWRRDDGLQTIQVVGIAGVGAMALTFGFAQFASVRKAAGERHDEANALHYNSPAPKPKGATAGGVSSDLADGPSTGGGGSGGSGGGGPPSPGGPSTDPSTGSGDAAGQGLIVIAEEFSDLRISAESAMPTLKAAFTYPADPLKGLTGLEVRWTVTVTFDGSQTKGGKPTANPLPPIQKTMTGPLLAIAPGEWGGLRGGTVRIQAATTIDGKAVTAEHATLTIKGTNAPDDVVLAAIDDETLTKIARHEIRAEGKKVGQALPHFGKDGWPIFNRGGDGGVGLMQLTPPDGDDQVWNWRRNVAEGKDRFKVKRATAKQFPARVRKSAGFQAAVEKLNAARKAQSLPAVTVEVPEFTDEQREMDAIRGYNGYAGKDWLVNASGSLHEFRLAWDPDASDPNGRLLRTVPVPGKTDVVAAVWERVPPADRTSNPAGTKDYVDQVLGTAH